MVMFTCNECGEALKRSVVEIHHMKNKYCQSLACMDCGKDFWRNEYKDHIKCVSEKEKYGGKNFKSSVNKGECKQEKWIEHIKNTINSEKLNGPLKQVLQRMIEYPNIPRKQKKFENFLKSSLRIQSKALIAEAWAIFDQDTNKSPADSNGSESTEFQNKNSNENECKTPPATRSKSNKRPLEEKPQLTPVKRICQNNAVVPGSTKRFQWCKIISRILRDAPDQTLPLSKLRKKVFAEYSACVGVGAQSKTKFKSKLKTLLQKNKHCNVYKL